MEFQQGSPRGVGDGDGEQDRQTGAMLPEELFKGEDRGLQVEGVEGGLCQQEIDTALDEPLGLLTVSLGQLVEGDGPVGRVVDVRGQRSGSVGRPQRAGDKAGSAGVRFHEVIDRFAGESRRRDVELPRQALEAVVRLGDRGAGEGVGLDNIRSRLEERPVNVADEPRPGQAEEVIVALELAGVVLEAFRSEVSLGELMGLDHRPHGAIQHEDTLSKRRSKPLFCRLVFFHVTHRDHLPGLD